VTITDRLTRKLRGAFGSEAADDMVGWMHGIETQRSELREMNEANYARVDAGFDRLEQRMTGVEQRIGGAEQGISIMAESLAHRLEAIERRHANLLKWAMTFWIGSFFGTMVALAAMKASLP